MQAFIEVVDFYSGALVPMLAVWAMGCLFMHRGGHGGYATHTCYFTVMLLVAGLTVRTMLANDACWLIHTSSLGVMIVAGVMRRPSDATSLGRWEMGGV